MEARDGEKEISRYRRLVQMSMRRVLILPGLSNDGYSKTDGALENELSVETGRAEQGPGMSQADFALENERVGGGGTGRTDQDGGLRRI